MAEVTARYATHNASEVTSRPRILGEVIHAFCVLSGVEGLGSVVRVFVGGVRVFAWSVAALRTREPQV